MKKGPIAMMMGMIGLLFSLSSFAQTLPALPVSSEIKKGTLDNGINYYLVKNNTDKGSVCMALVQRTGMEDETERISGQTIVNSRKALTDLPRFSATSPFGFMNRKALFPGRNGYVSVTDDATIYRFDNVMVSNSREALDSTLLMIFDIISLTTNSSDRYSTATQAIIVAGDIDQNSFLSKMNMLALLVPRKGQPREEPAYVWKDREKMEFYLIPPVRPGHSSIMVEYSAPRTPKEGMNTVQSLTSEKLANELNIVLKNRLGTELRRRKIPCSVVSSSYKGSARYDKDEKIRIVVSTDDAHVSEAVEVTASVLADLDNYGSYLDEYKDVQNEFKIGLGEVYDHIVRLNTNFVDRCISSFLYNAPLSSAQYNYDFFYKRVLDPQVELSFFNNYLKAVLDPEKNLRLVCASGVKKEEGLALEADFKKAWQGRQGQKPSQTSYNGESSDLRKMYPKAKIKVETAEPMTGGKIWTFSNGMRVIYKQAGRDNFFHYELLLKTGFSQAANIQNAEKAYLSDIMALNNIAGMSGPNFNRMLNANGISMTTEVSISDLTIRGTGPERELPLLLRSLLAIGYDRKPAPDQFSYYRDCARLQLDYFKDSKVERIAVLDSLLCPSMSYSPFRRAISLSDDFPMRAGRFYDTVFSNACDGVLIIVGNFDEEELKKTLCRYIGGFKYDNTSSYRSRRQNGCIEGRSSLVKTGKHASLDLMFDTPINYTSENYMNIKIAAMAMRDALGQVAASMGWSLAVNGKFIMFPEEKFNYTIQMEPANISGLPASMVQQPDVEELMDRVNEAIDDLARRGLDNARFGTYKALLSNMLDEDMSDPNQIQHFLVMRYSYGKDLMTKYKDKVGALNVAKVNAILSDMAKGAIAEYGIMPDRYGEEIYEAAIHKPVLPKSAPVRPATDSLGILKLYRSLFHE